MKKIFGFSFLIALVFISTSCKKTDEQSKINSEKGIVVFTSILPQKYFVEAIAGDRVQVEVLVRPGKSPATYEPTPQQVTALGNAKMLFSIGVPFEKAFLPTIRQNLPTLQIVDTSHGIKKRILKAHHHDDEGEDHEEHAEIKDPHIWLSPKLVKIQAKNILDALVQADAEGKQIYEKNYETFVKELDELQAELKKTFAPYKGKTIFVFHPAFGYLTDELGLEQEAIETGGKEPSPAVLQEIIEEAKKDKVKIIFVQKEFSKDSAQKIAEAIDGVVVSINPLHPDYINNIRNMAVEIEKAFK